MFYMSNLSAKTTIYLDPNVKKFLQHNAIAESRSLSEVINEQFEDMLEDLSDIQEIEKRRSEQFVTFEEALKNLGLTYDQLQS
jgi:predicted transcriptional regulator